MGLRRGWCLCALVLLALAASCSTLRPVPGIGLAGPEREWLGHARVSLRDGTELVLDEAAITPDSIVGLGGSTRARFAVPRNEVVGVDTQRTAPGWTFLAGVLAPIAFMLLYVAAVQGGG